MRSSSLNWSSSNRASGQSKTGLSAGWRSVAAAACGFMVVAPGARARVTLALAALLRVGDECGRLDLDLGTVLDKGDDLHQCHRREMATDNLAPATADLRQTREVFAFVNDIPSHAGDMLRLGVRRREHGDGIAQRLLELTQEIIGRESLLGGPADLSRDENEAATPGHSIRIALRLRPAGRVDRLQTRCGLRGRAGGAGGGRHGSVVPPKAIKDKSSDQCLLRQPEGAFGQRPGGAKCSPSMRYWTKIAQP